MPLKTALQARVSIGLLVNGDVTPMHSQTRVRYCIFRSGACCIGFQFVQRDRAMASTLARFLR